MNLHFLGGAMEIGGSCIYIQIAGKNILFDSGIRQSTSKDPLPDFHTIQEQGGLDAIIVSHAHMDHIGTLPIISKAYPNARIYMTAMTADLTRVLLYDSLKIMNAREDEIPHYSQQDVLAMLGRIFPIGYQTPFPIFDRFTLTFYPAGHIAGAACVYLVTSEGSLFYSGDFSSFAQRTIEGIRIPKLRPDVSIVETTYGNRLHANRLVEEKRLVELVKTCLVEKKKLLIPAFALGRAQEVLLILRTAIQNQEIPAVPIYVDGMVRDINQMYTRNPTYLKHSLGKRILKGNEPFYTKQIQPVAPMQNRDDLLSGPDPVILISSSGMLTGGPSAQYAGRLAPMENACIIITGYQDEESPGRQLLNLLENPKDQTLTINNKTVPVKCRIEQVGLSAHGDKSEIMSLLDRLSSRNIFLVHGNKEAIEELGSELANEDYRRRIYLPECGQEYEILLHNKRKQLSFQPAFTLQMQQLFTKEDEKQLWNYWQAHYLGKTFSVSQIANIWYGKAADYLNNANTGSPIQTDADILENMQEILLNSDYFSPNTHRLFLFEANTPEAVAQALAPKELTVQDLELQLQTLFPKDAYRKISYYPEKKEVLLQFDYPDSQDIDEFNQKAKQFTDATGWALKIHPSMNHNAVALLLSAFFGNRLTKTSYYAEKKCYAITLSKPSTSATPPLADAEAAKQFYAKTGWTLLINGRNLNKNTDADVNALSKTKNAEQTGFFTPTDNMEQLEQNTAFSLIDQTFCDLPCKPDKKSIKHDVSGKYIEISFLSPALGMRCEKTLQTLADQAGWRICIADKVNQNELFKIIQLLCLQHDLTLAKNPSYLPDQKAIRLKLTSPAAEETLQAITDEFDTQTGCHCFFE